MKKEKMKEVKTEMVVVDDSEIRLQINSLINEVSKLWGDISLLDSKIKTQSKVFEFLSQYKHNEIKVATKDKSGVYNEENNLYEFTYEIAFLSLNRHLYYENKIKTHFIYSKQFIVDDHTIVLQFGEPFSQYFQVDTDTNKITEISNAVELLKKTKRSTKNVSNQ